MATVPSSRSSDAVDIVVKCRYLSSGKSIPKYVTVSRDMSIHDIIQELVRAYARTPYDIDNGVCDYFGSDLILTLEAIGKVAEGYWTPDEEDLPGHFWVETDGLFYDAETPFGVSDWHDLLIFKKAIKSNRVPCDECRVAD